MKIAIAFVVILLGMTLAVGCGNQNATETETKTETKTETTTTDTAAPKGDFEKFAELDWVKIGVLKGWTETIDATQKTISLTDNSVKIDLSYTISGTPDKYSEEMAAGASGTVKKDKVTYNGVEFIRHKIEYGGSVMGVNLYAPYASDGTSIVNISADVTPDIEKMLNSIVIK